MSAHMGFGDSKADQTAVSMSDFSGMQSTKAFKGFSASLPSKTQAPAQQSSFGFASNIKA